ncbi:MAG: DUF1553 domain-containing protein [Gemmataceae bacterium]|nr:DUF1553 domain-containing protein [Gemmataceae bacterium]
MPVLLLFFTEFLLAAEPAKVDFARQIQPLFQEHCHSCHGKEKQKGDLRLDIKANALRGGESGAVIIPGKPHDSILWKNITGQPGATQMPKRAARLQEKEIALIAEWIRQGANWPADGSEKQAVWWSLVPPIHQAIPKSNPAWVRNPIDSFLLEKMRGRGLTPSNEASRLALIRRVTFDLTGMPPAPAEVDFFLNDSSPDAYERLVDRLLASPRHGERWARHWLDLVHYGDTHGYDKDKPRPNAWPYRDYVIRAFNGDKSFGLFAREQIAGDALFPASADGMEALGFLAAGPWDFIGHAEVPESKIDGKIARHLDRDDMVGNTMATFLSLTVQCAQCHHHKFDPVTQEDYYSLQAVFAALDRTDRKYHASPEQAAQFARMSAEKKSVEKEIAAVESRLPGQAELREIDKKLRGLQAAAIGKRPEFGYHGGIETKRDTVKWVQVDLGAEMEFSSLVLHPCHDDFNNIGAGFGFPLRFRVEAASDPDFKKGALLLLDATAADFPNPGLEPVAIPGRPTRARFVRVTSTQGAPRQNDFIFVLAELRVLDRQGNNLALGKAVTALDSIEAPVRWARNNLTDGIWFEGEAGKKKEIAGLQKRREELNKVKGPAAELARLQTLQAGLVSLEAELKAIPFQTVYSGGIHTGSGAFSGTGSSGGLPRQIFLLKRGNILNPAKEMGPGAVASLAHLPPRFDLPPGHNESVRRVALAQWITHPNNPLLHRSIVNRVWRWHFGRGLVETPSDFGRMGKEPTHPDLLDWLAVEFRNQGESLKWLHRLIVTSAAYRQESASDGVRANKDGDNAYYWRMNRRKLEAEAIRDSVLTVSGAMRQEMFGPAFQDFIIEKPEHSPHYQYHLFNPENPLAFRRSVYRFLVRSQQQPFMATLDCADPSIQVDKRNETISSLQALALLNNGFMLTQAKVLAARLEKDFSPEERVTAGFRLALGRSPTPGEQKELSAFTQQHGLAALARVLFNLNEFAFVD